MKNIIYGLGQYFWNSLEFHSDIFKNTVALCDADVTKFQRASSLNLPVVTPNQLPDVIASSPDVGEVYISTLDYYDEIFNLLTQQLKLSNIDIMPCQVQIKMQALEAATLLPSRTLVFEHIPKNGIAAEVGVAYGDFSRKIIDNLSPNKFFAIDYFSQDDPFLGFFGRDNFIKDNMPHQQWYENRFKAEIESGLMETRQGLSWDCLAQFPDNYFDYAYLDAAHDYHSVRKDLKVLIEKVKNGGFIQFNDYCPGAPRTGEVYGVIAAVNRFINSGQHKVKYFCLSTLGNHDIVVQICKTAKQ